MLSRFFCVLFGLIALSLLFTSCYAQNGQIDVERPTIRNPSANATSLGKFGDIPVSQYTGVPNISIPFQTINYADLKVDISLSYHGSGIKVEEESSWVGLGWSLNAGGVITRTIRGEDDFPEVGYSYPDNINIDKGKGFFKEDAIPDHDRPEVDGSNGQSRYHSYTQGGYTLITSFLNPYQDLSVFQEKIRQGSLDGQADMFNFNFNGHSGKFIINKKRNSSELYHVVLLSKEDLKIELLADDLSGKQGFKVTDDNGIAYLFQQLEISRSKSGESTTGKLKYDQTPLPGVSCNSGLLRDIQEDLNGNFYYPGDRYNYSISSWYLTQIISPAGASMNFVYEKSQSFLRSLPTRSQRVSSSASPPACIQAIKSFSFTVNETQTVTLREINYSKFKVLFNTSPRIDMRSTSTDQVKKLDNIEYQYNGVKKNKWSLGYSYFDSGSNRPDYISKRLKLNFIQEEGEGLDNTKYYFDYVDPVYRPLPDKDSYAQDLFGYFNGQLDNDSKICLVPNYSLYTTASNAPFGWIGQSNFGNREVFPEFVTAGMLKVITYPTGGFTVFDFESNEYSNGEDVNYNIGNYHMVNGSTNGDLLTVPPADVVNDILMRYGGGCRIAKIRNYLTDSQISSQIQYDYQSSGKVMFGMKHLTFDNFDFSNPSYKLTSHSMYTLASSAAGSQIGYSDVKEYTTDGFGIDNGFKEFEFENKVESNTSLFTFVMNSCSDMRWKYSSNHLTPYVTYCGAGPFIQRRDLAPVAIPNLVNASNGNLLAYSVYDKDQVLQFKKVNVFEENDVEYLKYAANHPSSTNYDKFTYIVNERAVFRSLKSSHTNDHGIESSIRYSYDPNFRHYKNSLILVSNSNGSNDYISYRYSPDFTATSNADDILSGISTLNQKHVIAPIEVTKGKYNNGNKLVTSSELYGYNHLNTKLDKVFSASVQSPVLEGNFIQSQIAQNGSFVKDNRYELRKIVQKFNILGQPSWITNDGVRDESYVYDETTSTVLAETKNSAVDHVAYSGFETTSSGQWQYNQSQVENGGYSGDKSFHLGFTNNEVVTKGGLDINKVYSLTYWKRGTDPAIVNGEQSGYPIAGQTYAGWTFFQHKISGVAMLTISGEGNIDELRFFPDGATMSTYTYNPLVGVSSATDSKALTVHYMYDGLNRLKSISDEKKNVLKEFSYRHVELSQQPVYYFNSPIAEIITRDNCPDGKIAGAAVYNVPASKYLSTLSQADANAKARNEVNIKGQLYANTFGGCSDPPPPVTTIVFEVNNPNTVSFNASFRNTISGIYYNFSFMPGMSSPGSIPAGTYDIFITPSSGTTLFEWFIGDYQASPFSTLSATGIGMHGSGYIYIAPY